MRTLIYQFFLLYNLKQMNLPNFYQREINRLVEILKNYRPQKVIVFGSVAKGKAKRESDIDLCIIKDFSGKKIEEKQKIRRLFSSFNYDYPVAVDLHLYSPSEFDNSEKNFFIEEIKKTGLVVYE